jgi:hypothetical protein
MTEIKTYEEVYTGKTVSYLLIDLNIGIILSFVSGCGALPLRSSHWQFIRDCLEDHPCGARTQAVHGWGKEERRIKSKQLFVSLLEIKTYEEMYTGQMVT